MKAETLKTIKESLAKFHTLIEAVSNHWSNPHYITMSVLLQNAAFDGSDCEGYSHEEEVKKLYDIQDILRQYSEYYNSHFEKSVYEEVNSIITGFVMFED